MDRRFYTRVDSESLVQVQKRISIIFSITGISVTFANIILSHFLSHMSLYETFTDTTVYLTLIFTIPFAIISYIRKNSFFVQISQVIVLFLAFTASALDQYNSIYGLAFYILAISLMYKYRMLDKNLTTKIFFLYIFAIIVIGISAYNSRRVLATVQVIFFITFFLFICYIVFKSEMDKIISTEKRMKNEILNLVIDRDMLKDQIDDNQRRFEELEQQYLEYKKEKKPFDFEKCNLTPSEINVIRVLVQDRASNKEISEKLNIKESTVKQHLYRIFNKIGVDNRIQLMDLCEYNF